MICNQEERCTDNIWGSFVLITSRCETYLIPADEPTLVLRVLKCPLHMPSGVFLAASLRSSIFAILWSCLIMGVLLL